MCVPDINVLTESGEPVPSNPLRLDVHLMAAPLKLPSSVSVPVPCRLIAAPRTKDAPVVGLEMVATGDVFVIVTVIEGTFDGPVSSVIINEMAWLPTERVAKDNTSVDPRDPSMLDIH